MIDWLIKSQLNWQNPQESSDCQKLTVRLMGVDVWDCPPIDNLLVRIHFIIVKFRWTGLAPWEFEFPFPGSLTSAFLGGAALSDERRFKGRFGPKRYVDFPKVNSMLTFLKSTFLIGRAKGSCGFVAGSSTL